MVLVIGLPIFFVELFVGQYSGLGPILAYGRLAPFFQGKRISSGSLSRKVYYVLQYLCWRKLFSNHFAFSLCDLRFNNNLPIKCMLCVCIYIFIYIKPRNCAPSLGH